MPSRDFTRPPLGAEVRSPDLASGLWSSFQAEGVMQPHRLAPARVHTCNVSAHPRSSSRGSRFRVKGRGTFPCAVLSTGMALLLCVTPKVLQTAFLQTRVATANRRAGVSEALDAWPAAHSDKSGRACSVSAETVSLISWNSEVPASMKDANWTRR